MYKLQWRSKRPLSLARATERFLRWGPDPVNVVADNAYWRVASAGDEPFPYCARQVSNSLLVISAPNRENAEVAARDLSTRVADRLPWKPIAGLAARDPMIGEIWRALPGYRPSLTPDPFEMLVTSITAQQVNLRWATTTRARLVHEFGQRMEWRGRTLWQFPLARDLAAAEPDELRAMQFSWRKAEYITGVARAAADGYLDGIERLSDIELVEHVTGLRGVGRWTADWLMARGLGRPHVVAAGDLGVRKAVGEYLGQTGPAPESDVRRLAERWADAANWAVHLLLEGLHLSD